MHTDSSPDRICGLNFGHILQFIVCSKWIPDLFEHGIIHKGRVLQYVAKNVHFSSLFMFSIFETNTICPLDLFVV